MTAILTSLFTNGAWGPLAHVGPLIGPSGWRSAWNTDPWSLTGLVASAALYAWGALCCRWAQHPARRGHYLAFAGGWLTLALALVSPLDAISSELSSAHMVQHMVLMNVAAPLLVLGAPLYVMLWGLPLAVRRRVGRGLHGLDAWSAPLLWNPVLVPIGYALVLWGWHIPLFYQAALRDRWIHDAEHLSFLIAALLFWRLLLDPLSRRRVMPGAGALCLFVTSIHATALGVLMTISPQVWYRDYELTTRAWGLSPLEDQQLAGLIMWMPGCVPYALGAVLLLAAWIHGLSVPSGHAAMPATFSTKALRPNAVIAQARRRVSAAASMRMTG